MIIKKLENRLDITCLNLKQHRKGSWYCHEQGCMGCIVYQLKLELEKTWKGGNFYVRSGAVMFMMNERFR